jgi:hypothetical protein
MRYIVYVNYNNGSNVSLFSYPNLEHAQKVGKSLLTQAGTVNIYEGEPQAEWGDLKLVEKLVYKPTRK